MSTRLLRMGDVFLIEKGQPLYVKDHGCDKEEVRAGEPTEHQEYKKDMVVFKGRKYFSGSYLETIQHKIPRVGEYVVVSTEYCGGGTGMGPHDVFPDGHMVIAKPVNGRGTRVSFYQTGCFTAMLENPKIIRKATKK